MYNLLQATVYCCISAKSIIKPRYQHKWPLCCCCTCLAFNALLLNSFCPRPILYQHDQGHHFCLVHQPCPICLGRRLGGVAVVAMRRHHFAKKWLVFLLEQGIALWTVGRSGLGVCGILRWFDVLFVFFRAVANGGVGLHFATIYGRAKVFWNVVWNATVVKTSCGQR